MKNFYFVGYSLCGLISAFFLSWIILAQFNFAYSALYEVMDIRAHVLKFGPQNRYRNGFQYTNKAEHERLFEEINHGIHDNGNGLSQIDYYTPRGNKIDSLLREPEVVHLEDVATLVNVFFSIAYVSMAIWILSTLWMIRRAVPLPSLKKQSLSILMLTFAISVLVLLIGPTKVFYAFHVWLFPADHQWFFYYQESLMTILMKAPNLFGYIAILLVALALTIFVGMSYVLNYLPKMTSTFFTRFRNSH